MMRAHMDLLANSRFTVNSTGLAAGYAGWLLRSLGAEVEHACALDPEGMGAFLGQGATFTASPRLEGEPGGTLITDCPVTPENRAQLSRLGADRRVIWITPWGLDSDWSEEPDSDLALYAASGWMASVGDPDREPLAPPDGQCRFIAGLFATIAALEPSVNPKSSAPGLIDVPVIEALTATLIYDSVSFQYYGAVRGRVGNRFSRAQPLLATLACKDGFMGLHSALHWQWVALAELIGHPELINDPRFGTLAERAVNIGPLDEEYLLPWLAERTRWQAYHELQAARIPSSGHPDMAELLASPQLNARAAFDTVSTPSGRTLRVPAAPVRVLAEAGPAALPARVGPWRPGALRVVDFSMGWAGPMVTFNLACMGADVIKVESHTHVDWWRGSRPPGDGDGLGLHERSHVFNTTNRGKRGIALDLIASADVMVENYAAGVIEKLGLTWEAVSTRNPSLVMLRQPGFGSTGPESGYVVFGNTIEGMSGLTALVGYEDGPPTMLSNAFGDPVSGLGGTVAVLAALRGRAHDGRGRLLECAQLEGFLPMVSEALVRFQQTGAIPERRGNRRIGHEPSGAFTLGDNRWLVIDVEDDTQWAALARAIATPWALAPELATVDGRAARRFELSGNMAAWVRESGEEAVLAACKAAGVPCSLVLNEGEVLGLEPLLMSNFWQGMDREPVGFHLYPTVAYHRAGERPITELPAPFLGQHTDEVLLALGYSDQARELLISAGVTGRILVAAS
jgi:crotonobetainyl-CoA:carnitine CoA-transferase CaiB-like acyl-CoA transferase